MPSVLRPVLASAAFLSVSGLLLVAAPQTQDASERAMLEKIKVEGLGRSQAMATFTHFVDVVGPRLTATPAYKAAAEWSRDRLTEWGLANARLESWEFGRGWQLEKFTLEMVEPRYMPLMGYPEGWSASMPAEITGRAVARRREDGRGTRGDEVQPGGRHPSHPAGAAILHSDRPWTADRRELRPPAAGNRPRSGWRPRRRPRPERPAGAARGRARRRPPHERGRARHDVRARPRSR